METENPFATDENRWKTIVRRNPSVEDIFYYAVKTTGVFCRPGCASRLPNRKNVEFFDTCKDAVRAGYRPLAGDVNPEPSQVVRR